MKNKHAFNLCLGHLTLYWLLVDFSSKTGGGANLSILSLEELKSRANRSLHHSLCYHKKNKVIVQLQQGAINKHRKKKKSNYISTALVPSHGNGSGNTCLELKYISWSSLQPLKTDSILEANRYKLSNKLLKIIAVHDILIYSITLVTWLSWLRQ